MSPKLLRETRPTARERHECSACTDTILPGDTYYRDTIAFDARVYDWLECPPCRRGAVMGRARAWANTYAWIDQETALEWASEQVIHGDTDEQRAAKDFLERWHAARREGAS